MRKLLTAFALGVLLCGLTSCGMLRSGYANPVTGQVSYKDPEKEAEEQMEALLNGDLTEEELEERLREAERKKELGEEIGDLAGNLVSAGKELTKARNLHLVSISGKEYDLAGSPRELLGALAGDNLKVYDTNALSSVYDKNGEKVKVSMKDFGWADLYAHLVDADVLAPDLHLVLCTDNTEKAIKENGILKFRTADGLTQTSESKDLDQDHYLQVGAYGYNITGRSQVERYAAVVADGEYVDPSGCGKELEELIANEISDDEEDFIAWLKENTDSACSYGVMQVSGSDVSISETEELKNLCILNLMLADCAEKLQSGELSSVIVVTFEGADTSEDGAANIGWHVYSL